MLSWSGSPYQSQHSWIMKKAMIFGLGGGGRREMEIQEVIVDQNSARVCVRLALSSRLSIFSV